MPSQKYGKPIPIIHVLIRFGGFLMALRKRWKIWGLCLIALFIYGADLPAAVPLSASFLDCQNTCCPAGKLRMPWRMWGHSPFSQMLSCKHGRLSHSCEVQLYEQHVQEYHAVSIRQFLPEVIVNCKSSYCIPASLEFGRFLTCVLTPFMCWT